MHAIIGTWKMSLRGVTDAFPLLIRDGAGDAVTSAICAVENDPAFTSVGYGGLPDSDGRVMLDAAYMDGDILRFGGIMSVENVVNPILLARMLCGRETNCLLAGRGAEQAAISFGLPMRDMRTASSLDTWKHAVPEKHERLTAYHDTVCVLALDDAGHMVSGTSTSGLFMKAPGRVGDSPIVGSGFYCDSRYGAAAATGLGEDVMRGCLSYEVVSLMRRGASPEEACRDATSQLVERKHELGEDDGSISLIALNPRGEFGASTTLPTFPFSAGTDTVRLYAASNTGSVRIVSEAEMEGEP